MIDIHTHILPEIDDGARSTEESINILKKASSAGVKDIILTPHFILGSKYDHVKKDNKKKLTALKRTIKKENIDINLYLGNEVFVENNMLELLEKEDITTLNDSKYLLFELPRDNYYQGLKEIIFHLRAKGIIPIIAHPERYAFLKEDPTLVHSLLDEGALLQVNLSSFFGKYGKNAMNLAKLFLSHNMVSFISSDIHHETDEVYSNISKFKSIASKFIKKEEIEDILTNNAKCVIENKKIAKKEFTPIKHSLFKGWK